MVGHLCATLILITTAFSILFFFALHSSFSHPFYPILFHRISSKVPYTFLSHTLWSLIFIHSPTHSYSLHLSIIPFIHPPHTIHPPQDSFSRAKVWIEELQKQASPDIIIALAANKNDLEASRAISFEVPAAAVGGERGKGGKMILVFGSVGCLGIGGDLLMVGCLWVVVII